MEVTIDGFIFGGTTGVSFGGRTASYRITAATQLRATVPPGATNGPIQVVTPAGVAPTTNDFVVTGPGPILDSFSPTIGAPGTEVLVYGANFTNVTAVTFNKAPAAEFSVPASTQIRTRSATNATTGKIAITTSGGSVTSVVDFVITRAPVITAFTPPVGRDGFTQVTIEGLNFSDVRGQKILSQSLLHQVNHSYYIPERYP